MTENDRSLDTFVSFAHQLADTSATTILPHFRSDLRIDNKAETSGFDPVTEGDRAAETTIRNLIQKTYPDHAVLGEEHGTKSGNEPYRWVIDPIDGTRAFILGLPTWGTLIGLEIDEKPTIGLMNQPFTQDRFWSDGEKSYFRGAGKAQQEIQTRQTVMLASALMASSDPSMFKGDHETAVFGSIRSRAKSCRFGTDCFGYALLAAGLVDLVVEASLQPYDIVALIPIIENAGGVITTWDGGDPRHGGRIIAAANATLHAEVLDLTRTG